MANNYDQVYIQDSGGQSQQGGPVGVMENINPQVQLDGETTRWLFNPMETLLDLKRNLGGQFLDPNTQRWITRGDAVLMNDTGIYVVMNLVRSHLYKHVSLSNLTEDEINRIVFDVIVNLIDVLELKYEDYAVDETNLSTIRRIVESTVLTNLKRALGGKAADSLHKSYKSTEVVRPNEPSRRSVGFL